MRQIDTRALSADLMGELGKVLADAMVDHGAEDLLGDQSIRLFDLLLEGNAAIVPLKIFLWLTASPEQRATAISSLHEEVAALFNDDSESDDLRPLRGVRAEDRLREISAFLRVLADVVDADASHRASVADEIKGAF